MKKIQIEIWSDMQCPFCFIGKRQLEKALTGFDRPEAVQIEWKSFQLDPTAQSGTGETIEEYLSRRKGIPMERVKVMHGQVDQMAKAVGLNYAFDKMKLANSRHAHRLVQWSKSLGKAEALEERLFKAYFLEGKDLGNDQELLTLAEEAGFDRMIAASVVEDKDGAWDAKVQADVEEASQIGCTGVPFFVFNREFAVSGAQGVPTLLRALQKAAAEPAFSLKTGG